MPKTEILEIANVSAPLVLLTLAADPERVALPPLVAITPEGEVEVGGRVGEGRAV